MAAGWYGRHKSNHPGVLCTPPLLIQGGETHEG
jgi:hypothetical protein